MADTYNGDWLTNAYQTYLGRAPDQNGYNYWIDMLNNNGVSRQAVVDDFRNSPEAVIGGLYSMYRGDRPDADSYEHFQNVLHQPDGLNTARNEIMNTMEARNYAVGDGFRDQGRAATSAINQMPYVFSDYTSMVPEWSHAAAAPKTPLDALFGPSAGQTTLDQANGLLGAIFAPKPEEETDDTADTKKKAAKTPATTPDMYQRRERTSSHS
jgi:hypothetical protein